MERYVIKTKVEDGGVLGFGKKPLNPADYSDEDKRKMAEDVADTFLQKGIESGEFPGGANYRIVANDIVTGQMTTTIEIL